PCRSWLRLRVGLAGAPGLREQLLAQALDARERDPPLAFGADQFETRCVAPEQAVADAAAQVTCLLDGHQQRFEIVIVGHPFSSLLGSGWHPINATGGLLSQVRWGLYTQHTGEVGSWGQDHQGELTQQGTREAQGQGLGPWGYPGQGAGLLWLLRLPRKPEEHKGVHYAPENVIQ